MLAVKQLITLCNEKYGKEAYVQIKEALRVAIRELDGITLYGGSRFVNHSINIAIIAMEEMMINSSSVIATLLHDVVRLKKISLDDAQAAFGKECRDILAGLTSISQVETKTDVSQIEHFKDLIVSYSTDPYIILIKLADRLEVMRRLDDFPQDKRLKKSLETLHIYSQIAHKIGLYNIKSEMEDLSLKYLEPEDYTFINRKLADTAKSRENFITRFVAPINERLAEDKTVFSIKGRTKSIYSIWRKMKKQRVSFEEVYDVFAVRIIVDCEQKAEKSLCWHVYSVVTDFYKPNPDRMRDWISIPKSNGYESLHTTVVTDEGKWVEVQIRSERMDELAERGIAAHWRYKGVKDNNYGGDWLSHLRELMYSGEDSDTTTPLDKMVEAGNKEIFVFTPNGDLRKLSFGATILDFAYDIHSGLGDKCVGGKVNHKNVPIKEVLKNGDLVEIMTVKSQKPKTDWLNIAITSKARSRIKAFLREEQAKMASLGREELERKIKNWKLSLNLEESVNILMKHYKKKSGLDIYEMIANEKMSFPEIKDILSEYIENTGTVSKKTVIETTNDNDNRNSGKEKSKGDCLIIDRNLSGIEYKLAKCCNPVYGDDIFAFVTIMSGISVHRDDCQNGRRLKERYPYRILSAKWNKERSDGMFLARIGFVSDDVIGLDSSIRDLLKSLKTTLRSLNINYEKNGIVGELAVEVNSSSVLDGVIYNLKKIKGITKVYRL